jgi:curved DNA-binding protein CbpA
MSRPVTDLFGALGLAADLALTDDDVRAAWRRIAAASHPDRPDGGDPAAFAAAAAAYSVLRTRSGRGEALADLRQAQGAGGSSGVSLVPGVAGRGIQRAVSRLGWRLRRGRPWRLALRLAGAAAVGAIAVLAVGWQPAAYGLITGAVTWLVLTGRQDLAGPPGSASVGR